MSKTFTALREMSGISVKIREMSHKMLSGKMDKKLIYKLHQQASSITYLVLYANIFCHLVLNFFQLTCALVTDIYVYVIYYLVVALPLLVNSSPRYL